MVTKIISGGQTGVDRAALDLALELNIPCGGWCPRGRKAEDGPLPTQYPLRETSTDDYPERTELNVREADGTLVFVWGQASGGTKLTIDLATRHSRTCLVVDLREDLDPTTVEEWLAENSISSLNVAGPRESQAPGIYLRAKAALRRILTGSSPGTLPT